MTVAALTDKYLSEGMSLGEAIARAVQEPSKPVVWQTLPDGRIAIATA